MLAFAAGTTIFVVAEETVPEAKRGSPDIAATPVMDGFAVMMAPGVALCGRRQTGVDEPRSRLPYTADVDGSGRMRKGERQERLRADG